MKTREVKMNMLCVLLLILRTVAGDSTVDCSTSVQNVTCICTNSSLSCNGTQDDYLDIVEHVVNVSHGNILSVDISIENLILNPNSSFKDATVGNLKLSSGLLYLESHLFSGISESLLVLNLTYNGFNKVPSSALADLSELLILDLSHNNIKILSRNDFEGLYNLSTLNLSHNAITVVESETFSNLSLLKVLHLDHNDLQFLNGTVFKDLRSLKHLSISGNNFDSLSSESFTMLPIKTLSANNNNISELDNIQINSPKLQKLSVQHCTIQGPLKTDSLKDLSGLVFVDFSYNNITEVQHHALSASFQLKYVNLSYNSIKKLGKEAFSSLFNLVTLDLQHNDIQIVAESVFYNLTKLKYLNLNDNKLKALVCPYTADLFSMENIHLENNQIKTIDSGVFIYSPNLKELELTGNTLDCTCFLYDFSLYLLNRTSHWKEDTSAITCSSPQALHGKNVTEVDYSSMNCASKQPCESSITDLDYVDDDEESTVMTTAISEDSVNSTIPGTESTVTAFFDNATVDISVSDNPTPSSISTNLTIDYLGVVTTSSSTGLESTSSNVSESTTPTSLSEVSSTSSVAMIFSTVDITNFTDLGSTSSEIPPLAQTDLLVVTTERDNLTSEATSGPSWFSSSATEIPSPTSIPVSDVNSTSVNENLTQTAITGLGMSSLTTEVSESTVSISSAGTQDLTSTVLTTDSTVSESSINPFLLVTTHDTLIDIQHHSFKNKFLCIDWSVDHSILGDVRTCLVSYVREKGKPATIKRLKCPSSTDGTSHDCVKEKTAVVINEFCIKVHDSLSKVLAHVCSHEHYVDTAEPPLTSTLTSSSKHDTTASFTDPTVYNDTEPTEVFTITLEKISSHVTSPSTTTIHEEMTTVFTEEVLQPRTAFNITKLNVLQEGSFIIIDWTVNKNEPLDICALKLTVKTDKIDKAERDFSCSNDSYSVDPVESNTIYEICLTSNHSTHGIIPVCRNYVAHAGIVMSAVTSSKDYSYIVLTVLLVIVVCFLAFFVTRAILKSRSTADGYNVTKEERKVSLRNGSGGESVNYEHTSRYSYTASEAI